MVSLYADEEAVEHAVASSNQSKKKSHNQVTHKARLLIQKGIDKSTTFFTLHYVTEDCLMDKFATQIYPDYQAKNGHGYYEFTNSVELEEVESSLDIIVMDQVRLIIL